MTWMFWCLVVLYVIALMRIWFLEGKMKGLHHELISLMSENRALRFQVRNPSKGTNPDFMDWYTKQEKKP